MNPKDRILPCGPVIKNAASPGILKLDWDAGNIYTKNPDNPMIKKMVQIAHRLNAIVQGDDGEGYTGNEEGYPLGE
jgi:hypothetical protein